MLLVSLGYCCLLGTLSALGTDWGEDSNLLPKTFFLALETAWFADYRARWELGDLVCRAKKKEIREMDFLFLVETKGFEPLTSAM